MNLLQFDTSDAWVQTVTALFADRLWRNPQLRICLPAGQTPTPVYAALVRAVREGQLSFQRATVFSLDEFGGLAPGDPGRCVKMLERDLIDQVDLPAKQFHALDPDAPDLTAICRAYDEAIRPGFDLCLLGLGMNGHLGMNEPGSDPASPTRRVELAAETRKSSQRYLSHSNLPSWGVTVGMQQILNSKEVWLIVNGSAKARIVQQTLDEPISPAIPSTLLRKHPNGYLFVDTNAASLIRG